MILPNVPRATFIQGGTFIPESRVQTRVDRMCAEITALPQPFRLCWFKVSLTLTLFGLGLIKISNVLANFNNPKPSLILNN